MKIVKHHFVDCTGIPPRKTLVHLKNVVAGLKTVDPFTHHVVEAFRNK